MVEEMSGQPNDYEKEARLLLAFKSYGVFSLYRITPIIQKHEHQPQLFWQMWSNVNFMRDFRQKCSKTGNQMLFCLLQGPMKLIELFLCFNG